MKYEQLNPKYMKPYNYPINKFKDDLFWALHTTCNEVVYGSVNVATNIVELEEDINHFRFLCKYSTFNTLLTV